MSLPKPGRLVKFHLTRSGVTGAFEIHCASGIGFTRIIDPIHVYVATADECPGDPKGPWRRIGKSWVGVPESAACFHRHIKDFRLKVEKPHPRISPRQHRFFECTRVFERVLFALDPLSGAYSLQTIDREGNEIVEILTPPMSGGLMRRWLDWCRAPGKVRSGLVGIVRDLFDAVGVKESKLQIIAVLDVLERETIELGAIAPHESIGALAVKLTAAIMGMDPNGQNSQLWTISQTARLAHRVAMVDNAGMSQTTRTYLWL